MTETPGGGGEEESRREHQQQQQQQSRQQQQQQQHQRNHDRQGADSSRTSVAMESAGSVQQQSRANGSKDGGGSSGGGGDVRGPDGNEIATNSNHGGTDAAAMSSSAAAGGIDAMIEYHQQQQQQEEDDHPLHNDSKSVMTLDEERINTAREWELCMNDPYRASPESRYHRYGVTVDHHAGDRATEIRLASFQRPHMRALHCAWISFFLAFTIWFAPSPLLKEIQTSLGLSKKEIWTSSITNDFTAIIMRIIMGPICDGFAARIPMSIVLLSASIPTAMVGLVDSATGLAVVRLFIGVAGSSFVMAQFWPSRMFSREITGTANGLVGGWGNLGGAWTQLMMGRILFPTFRDSYFNGDSERAWRTICVIPASVAFLWGLILPWISDDAPMGNYGEMKKKGSMDQIFMTTSLRSGATSNTWILYAQYASSFGVEIVMNNAAVLYFTSEFGLSTEDASTIGFIYGSMNIFARALGGLISDRLNLKTGMRGRLWLQTILLFMEGLMIVVFAFTQSLVGAVVVMCIFSIFTQAAEGAIYGVVPYVSKLYTGSVAGFVGSGGNAGSVVYGFGFRSLPYRDAFLMMGCVVMLSSFLSFFINIPCHAGMISGEDNHAVINARERYMKRKEMERQQILAQQSMHNTEINTDAAKTGGGGGGEATVGMRAEVVDSVPMRGTEDIDDEYEGDGASTEYVDEVVAAPAVGGRDSSKNDEEKQL